MIQKTKEKDKKRMKKLDLIPVFRVETMNQYKWRKCRKE